MAKQDQLNDCDHNNKRVGKRCARVSRAFRTLLHSLRSQAALTLIAVVATTIEAGMQIAIPTIMADFIDRGVVAHSTQALWHYGMLLIIYAAIALATGVIAGVTSSYSCAGFAHQVRHEMFSRLQSLSFSDLDRFGSATLVTRLTGDVANVQMAYQLIVRQGVRSMVMIVVAWWFAFRMSASISLVFLAFVPVVFVITAVAATLVFPNFSRIFRWYDRMNAMVSENLRNMRVVKAYVRSDYELSRFKTISHNIYKVYRKTEYIMNYSFPLFSLCFYIGMLLIAWMASHEIVISGNNPALGLTTGSLAALITYAIQILVALTMIVMVLVMSVVARTSVHRIAEVLQARNSARLAANPLMNLSEPSIRFEHVSLQYPHDVTEHYETQDSRVQASRVERPTVLHDITISITAGQTVGIVGATGSGKSSLVQLIARLYDVSKGRIMVGGHDVRAYDPASLRESIGIVLQKNVLFSGTIAENLRWGNPQASDEQLRQVCEIACADEFIQEFPEGYQTHIDQGGTNVSGGQRQRLCIARALLKQPKILILDDALSAVDTKTDRRIREHLANFMPHATKIIVAARIASIEQADMIIVLDRGRVVATGTHDTLMHTCPMYREIALLQRREQVNVEQSMHAENACELQKDVKHE